MEIDSLNVEGRVLQQILASISSGISSVAEMSERWARVREEIARLEACCSVDRGDLMPVSGSCAENDGSLFCWKALNQKLEGNREPVVGPMHYPF